MSVQFNRTTSFSRPEDMAIFHSLRKPLIALLVFFLLQWGLIFFGSNPTWDAAFYFAYARSIVFDNDLRLENDLNLAYPTASADFVSMNYDEVRTETGRVHSPFSLGSALIWVPWLTVLRLVGETGQLIGLETGQFSGYEPYFTVGVATFSTLLGWFAFYLGYLIARKEIGQFSSLAATITTLFTTPLLYYQYREPLYAHATSAFVIAMVVYLWWRRYSSSPAYNQALLIGGLIGLAALVRSENLVFLILPMVSSAWWWLDLPVGQRKAEWSRPLIYCLVAGLSALALFSIQMAHWYLQFGKIVTVPQGPDYMDWLAPLFGPLFFSTFMGILPWMPIFILAFTGLFVIGHRNPRLAVPLLLALLLITYVNASSRDWFGGGGFGPRRFTSLLVIFIIGYAGFIRGLPGLVRRPLTLVVSLSLILHQWLLFRFGLAAGFAGTVVSMYPDYEWTDVSYPTFAKNLSGKVPVLFQSPRSFFVLEHSPIAQLLNGNWPAPQIASLLFTFVIITILIWLVRLGHRRIRGSRRWQWVLFGVVSLLIILTDLWILTWA